MGFPLMLVYPILGHLPLLFDSDRLDALTEKYGQRNLEQKEKKNFFNFFFGARSTRRQGRLHYLVVSQSTECALDIGGFFA